MLASMCAPSDVVNEKISAGEYACVDSQAVTAALFSSVRSFCPGADQTSTCAGWCTEEYRSRK
jgi:hypothetical protein